MKTRHYTSAILFSFLLAGCDGDDNNRNNAKEINGVRFIGELALNSGEMFDSTTIGGISGIDYYNDSYYIISDDNGSVTDNISGPIRIYNIELDYDLENFRSIGFSSMTELLDQDNQPFNASTADPESIRIDNGNIIWTSEGFINNSIEPFVRAQQANGQYIRDFEIDNLFKVSSTPDVSGPRHNTSFEGLSHSVDGRGYWVAMEGPLVQDGEAPSFTSGNASARIAYIDKRTGQFGEQFAIELDAISRQPASPGFSFSVNGIVEILEYRPHQFLMLERSFATNYKDGGNNVKLYKIDVNSADDISGFDSIQNMNIAKATKTLLLDFEALRGQLGDSVVDNIEGMTFGPELANGSRSLVLVSDDNFSLFGKQVNQFLAFEVLDEAPAADPKLSVSGLTLIGEQILGADLSYEGTRVGGLSSIDYAQGKYFMISDDSTGPTRFYTADLTFDENTFSNVEITSVEEILTLDNDGNTTSIADMQVDPEALRVDPTTGNIIWTSEGSFTNVIHPSVKEMGRFGEVVREFPLPAAFEFFTGGALRGPYSNLAFEGLSISYDKQGYWAAMEGPLSQDSERPTLDSVDTPTRIAYIDKKTGNFGKQFVYPLDPIVRRDGAADDAFKVTGLVEILAYDEGMFLVMERSFTAGQADGGNNVKIYKVDASAATDISAMENLRGANYTAATKTLVFDFETIRDQLTNGIVDNIEGMTFGPRLANGNHSLVVVSDNNFNAFGPQLTQLIAFQIAP